MLFCVPSWCLKKVCKSKNTLAFAGLAIADIICYTGYIVSILYLAFLGLMKQFLKCYVEKLWLNVNVNSSTKSWSLTVVKK